MAEEANYVCPVCGQKMMSANELCSGSFLDSDHPPHVAPIIGSPPVERRRDFEPKQPIRTQAEADAFSAGLAGQPLPPAPETHSGDAP